MGFEFVCTDQDGGRHEYEGNFHRGSEGLRIVKTLSALVVEPIGATLGPMATAMLSSGDAKSIKDMDASVFLREIDLSQLGRGVQSALQAVPDEFAWSVLRYTNRDGKALVDPAGKPTTALDQAYARNYLELGAALWEVCSANRFFPGAGFFESALEVGRALMPELTAKPGSKNAQPES